MSITVNLWSRKMGEIRRFLELYYEKDMGIEEDIGKWIYVYSKPLESVDIISALMDNSERYQITLCIQVNHGEFYPVTLENLNDVIKGIFDLYYQENHELEVGMQ